VKNFVAIYTGSGGAIGKWKSMPEDQRKEREAAGIKAWNEWVEKNKSSIVDIGSPLGRTKRASPAGVSDTRNNMTAYTVVQADSHEAAAKLFLNHPHFTIFPGDGVEIMECLPIPTAQ
jgi:hypothetical protein